MRLVTRRAAAASAALLLAGSSVFAAGVNVQTHVPAANARYVKTESAEGAAPGSWLWGLDYHYLDDALVELDPARERRTATLVRGLQTLDVTAVRQVGPTWALGASLPLAHVRGMTLGQASGAASPAGGESGAFALGDPRVFARVGGRVGDSAWRVALLPELRLPLGASDRFLSDGALGYGVLLAAERRIGRLSLAANLGVRRTEGARFRELDYRTRVPWAMALGWPVNERWGLNFEAAQSRVLPWNGRQNPGEFYAGTRYRAAPGLTLTAGGALGATNGAASQEYRVILGLRFATRGTASAPDSLPLAAAAPVRAAPAELGLEDRIAFAHGSWSLDASARAALDELAGRLKPLRIEVEGHCNELGSDAYNLALGARRAEAVADYLRARGLPGVELRPVSYGKRRPLIPAAPDESAAARAARLAADRRATFRRVDAF